MTAFQSRTCSNCEWTEDREEKLVGLWQDIPCLFYCSLHSYSNKHSKIRTYAEIAGQLDCTGLYKHLEYILCKLAKLQCQI